MILSGLLQLGLWLLVIPAVIGIIFYNPYKGTSGIVFSWIQGQTLLWALFFVAAVPLIIKEQSFLKLIQLYEAAVGVALAAAAVVLAVKILGRKKQAAVRLIKGNEGKKTFRAGNLFPVIFVVLLAVQLVMAVVLAYRDGDDAYYGAVANITESSNKMYLANVYSNGPMPVDYRRAMAPFPVWIAFLSRMSGFHTAIVGHVAVSAVMIFMANMILYLMGGKLFKDSKRYLFMIFAQLLILFGDYSMYTAERFLITRSRQGKAALGAIVIPLFFLLFFHLSDFMKNKKKIPPTCWLFFLNLQLSGLLCSTQGALLCTMMTVILGGLLAFSYKRWKTLVMFAAGCVPAGVVFLTYYLNTR